MAEANNCTIELVHGGTIHVPLSVSEVRLRLGRTSPRGTMLKRGGFATGNFALGLCTLSRSHEPGVSTSAAKFDVDINPDHVVAVLPLDSCTSKGGRE